MHKKFRFSAVLAIICCGLLLQSCFNKAERSRTTGWKYNDPNESFFFFPEQQEQEVGPGLVPIEGGTFTMGATEDNVYYEWNNTPRQVTVSSFYMDQTEVSNLDYLEYVYWMNHVYAKDEPQVVKDALPDTLVWRRSLSYNEPMIDVYFRHPAYRDYPVVGVSWKQAANYALWRTDRVNEILLIEAGVIFYDPDQNMQNNFSTDAYLAGEYTGQVENGFMELDPSLGESTRHVIQEDGIILPKYRLPTEAEWEYAALGLIGTTVDGRTIERRTYPWNSAGLRIPEGEGQGNFIANFKRGKGDYMGNAGGLNDGYTFPSPVNSYYPNDFGLYNMAGNVSEWVFDIYRPLSFHDFFDINPVRGNMWDPKLDTLYSKSGRIHPDSFSANYNDGDFMSNNIIGGSKDDKPQSDYTEQMYKYGETTLINDNARVYKGGSWADGPYYLSPSVRRYMQEDQTSATVGFRCAMNMIGRPAFNY
jgi:Uncharacterized conserved protein